MYCRGIGAFYIASRNVTFWQQSDKLLLVVTSKQKNVATFKNLKKKKKKQKKGTH